VTSRATTDQPDGPTPAPPARRKRNREILGPTGLIVMVAVIIGFTVVSIVVELASNWGKGGYQATVSVGAATSGSPNEVPVLFHVTNHGSRAGHPDVCDANLLDLKGERVGTASVTVRESIPPGQTRDFDAVGTVAAQAVNGTVRCRSLEPD
jgi:hypothetical protein